MAQLADGGDGFYAYVDTFAEAEKLFIHDLSSTLQVIGKDAKVQVDFNKEVVESYRLVGFENRDVADDDVSNDIRNDNVDASEIGKESSIVCHLNRAINLFHQGDFKPQTRSSGRDWFISAPIRLTAWGEVKLCLMPLEKAVKLIDHQAEKFVSLPFAAPTSGMGGDEGIG